MFKGKGSNKNASPVDDLQAKSFNTGDDMVGTGGCDGSTTCSESITGPGLIEKQVKLERFRLWTLKQEMQIQEKKNSLSDNLLDSVVEKKSLTS